MNQHRRAAFTLTEVLIALALISFLLVGISRIFTMTSSTISQGQSVSTALRSLKAIQQTMSGDMLGYSATGNIDMSDNGSGMMPLVVSQGATGAPYLSISSFRVAAFANETMRRTSDYQPADNLTPFNFATHSNNLRRVVDADGTVRVVPLYAYGERNFRTDAIGFFSAGDFQSQTGPVAATAAQTAYQSDVRSDGAFIWYGHPRIFNGNAVMQSDADAYGGPGEWMIREGLTGPYRPNANHRYASQFVLARMQMLCVEPSPPMSPAALKPYEVNTVTQSNGGAVPFVRRNWDEPGDLSNSTTLTPMNFDSQTYQLYPNTQAGPNQNVSVKYTGAPTFGEQFSGGDGPITMRMGRTDIIGASIAKMRARAEVLEVSPASQWRNYIPTQWTDRIMVNPFLPRQQLSTTYDPNNPSIVFNARVMAQRQQILSEGVSQFIIEYAGDFVTQGANGAFAVDQPDGVLDFVVVAPAAGTVPEQRAIRWYGMPRDVDEDGSIPGLGNAALRTSIDVVPLRDFTGGQHLFEAVVMPGRADYLSAVPANLTEPGGSNGSPDDSSYQLIWGPREFTTIAATVNGKNLYRVPSLLRVVVEMSDPKGRTQNPVVQEMVFPVKVTP